MQNGDTAARQHLALLALFAMVVHLDVLQPVHLGRKQAQVNVRYRFSSTT